MALTAKELATALGLEIDTETATIDVFTEGFNGKYVNRDTAFKDEDLRKKITGNVFGKLGTVAAQTFGLASGEVDGKKVEDILTLVKTKYDTQIADLTAKSGQGNDEKLNAAIKLQGELEAKLKIKDDGIAEWQKKYEDFEKESTGKVKGLKISHVLGKTKETLNGKFSDEYVKNEMIREGFNNYIEKTYRFDLDENDKPVVYSIKDNKPVSSKIKAGEIATPEEVFEMEMAAKGVLKKNNLDGNQRKPIFTQDNKDKIVPPTHRINPKAQAAIEKAQNRE